MAVESPRNGVALHRPSWRPVLDNFPVAFAYFLLLAPYFPFVIWIALDETYSRRGLFLRFIVQIVVYHALLGLSILSLIMASTRDPGSPSPEFIQTAGAAQYSQQEEDDFRGRNTDEDIPLSQLVPTTRGENEVPTKAIPIDIREELGEEDDYYEEYTRTLASLSSKDVQSQIPSRRPDEEPVMGPQLTISSKSTTGGQRWCRKCNAPKPDRCHHCRSCNRCILKMDHHCIWLNNCVGYANHRSFLLFLVYCTLYSAFCGEEGIWVVYRFFNDQGGDDDIVDFRPVAYLLIAMAGAVFALSIGSFLGFHIWLTMKNMTTLENLSASIPSAAISIPSVPSSNAPPIYSSRRRPSLEFRPTDRWKPDHELSRDERRKGKRLGKELNVYDLGWRRNLEAVFEGGALAIGDEESPNNTEEEGEGLLGGVKEEREKKEKQIWRWLLWAWPLTPKRRRALDGHTFPYSPSALEELKRRTAEIRLGLHDYDGSDIQT